MFPGADSVSVSVGGRVILLTKKNEAHEGVAIIPLVSGEASRLTLRVRSGERESTYGLLLELSKPRAPMVSVDASCSPWNLQILPGVSTGTMIIADCQMIRGLSDKGQSAVLDVALFIDGAGDE